MSLRTLSREQLEDALRAAHGEAEQYRREAMAFRFIANFESGAILEALVSFRYWGGRGFRSLLDAVEAAMKDETEIRPVVEEQSK